MSGSSLSRVSIRSYQVGFGDCFLLRFHYAEQLRSVLVDFGTTGLPSSVDPGKRLREIAEDIREACAGRLDVVVATHRHKDHIAGFATNQKGDGPGDVIRALKPRVVLLPWTEDPKAAPDAVRPTGSSASRSLVRSLGSMQSFAALLSTSLTAEKAFIPPALHRQLAFLGEANLANASAVRNLTTMGNRRVYAYAGAKTNLETILPGVNVHVLGPPTLAQSPAIQKQRSRDADEFWHLQARRADPGQAASRPPFAQSVRVGASPPIELRWIVPRARAARGRGLLELVRSLDAALNNTSLILLFEAGRQKLLFPGDAQLENWSYALFEGPDHEKTTRLLSGTTVYKVGHHGSLNATPKSLWKGFAHRGTGGSTRLTSLLSTMAGKHGSTTNRTEVPRATLLKALETDTVLRSTQDIRRPELYFEVELEA